MPFYRLEFDYVIHDNNFDDLYTFNSLGMGFETTITKKICILTKWEWLWGIPDADHFEQSVVGRLGASYILHAKNGLYEYKRKTKYTGIRTRTVTINFVQSLDMGVDMSLRSIEGTSFTDEDNTEPNKNLNLFFYTGYRYQKLYLKWTQPYDSLTFWAQGIAGFQDESDTTGSPDPRFTYGGRIGIRFYLFTGEITYINNELTYSIGVFFQTAWAKK